MFFLYARIVRSDMGVSFAIVLSCCFSSILTLMTSLLNSGMVYSMVYKTRDFLAVPPQMERSLLGQGKGILLVSLESQSVGCLDWMPN